MPDFARTLTPCFYCHHATQKGGQPFSDRLQEEWLDNRPGGRGVCAGSHVPSPRELSAVKVPRHQPGAPGAAAAHRARPAPPAGR